MKVSRFRLMLIPFLAMFWGQLALAAPPYGMAGCGLGSVLIDSNTSGSQISAATTNGSFTSQGFGITSGTSNCLEDHQWAALNAQQQFMVDNMNILSKEIAQGSGETLATFAMTFGCEEAVIADFSSSLQQSFGEIFAAPGALAALNSVRETLKSDEILSSRCLSLI